MHLYVQEVKILNHMPSKLDAVL